MTYLLLFANVLYPVKLTILEDQSMKPGAQNGDAAAGCWREEYRRSDEEWRHVSKRQSREENEYAVGWVCEAWREELYKQDEGIEKGL